VRGLTDAVGAVTDTYDYDAFGTLIHQTGSTPNLYLYCGEQWDPHLGFYYLRARYMNPSSGRFWSIDEYEGDFKDPGSLHRYLYTANNPIDRVDPSGYTHIGEMLCGLAIYSALSSLVGVTGSLFQRVGNRNYLPSVSFNTQLIIVSGSGWDYPTAVNAFMAASATWRSLANIDVRQTPIVEINVPNIHRTDGRLNYSAIRDAIRAKNIAGKHCTVFLGEIDFATPGQTASLGSDLCAISLSALYSWNSQEMPTTLASSGFFLPWLTNHRTPGAYAIAHEWGHTFDLNHTMIPGNLMWGSPIPTFFIPGQGQTALTNWQAEHANTYAARYI
jgi:RHS repeat-associated protein